MIDSVYDESANRTLAEIRDLLQWFKSWVEWCPHVRPGSPKCTACFEEDLHKLMVKRAEDHV